ncbi:hypothetical protein DAPPUDRAFT_322425 [Daphnia pulex]|uniref:PHD-type domain-containing protein n=1 Tax=Daphnia pulex TaxID=6669 RepID=E9GVX5_DAPPU|nr:hypothetical protein DAPPUDRAFT_322425 [Daphnia pulex]|eukprot:EFX76373.1 hypothetical protein DAPPUDRAFT_322425 [Daphnia pulex]
MTEELEASASRRSKELSTEDSANEEARQSVEEPVPALAGSVRVQPKITKRNKKATANDDDFNTSSKEDSDAEETRINDEEQVPLIMEVYEPLMEFICGWGKIVRKYNSKTTNHYKNWPFPRSSVASQRKASQAEVASSMEHVLITLRKKIFDEWNDDQGSYSPTMEKLLLKESTNLAKSRKRKKSAKSGSIPDGHVQCCGTTGFKCKDGHHKGVKCAYIATQHRELYQGLTHHAYNLEWDKPSVQRKIENLNWQVDDEHGIAEALQSSKFKRIRPYEINDGLVCSFCDRRVHKLEKSDPPTCKLCTNRIITTYRDISDREKFNYPLHDYESVRSERTLVFLCARKSNDHSKVDSTHFDKLYEAVKRSESKAGHFGDGNRPGFPKEMLIVGKFASSSTARAPLSAMNMPTLQQADDVATLNLLPDFIVNAYRPGDIILIAMSQPTMICIGHQDLEVFISELFERGIPEDSVFFFCRGLKSENSKTVNYPTNVLAADVRNAIRDNMPRYGMRPAVSAFLYASTKVAVSQRVNRAEQGRFANVEEDHTTPSQVSLKGRRDVEEESLICDFPGCLSSVIGSRLAVQCGMCCNWFHADCIDLTSSTAEKFNAADMEWLCQPCATPAKLGQRYLLENRLELAVEFCNSINDHTIFLDIISKGMNIFW